MSRIAKKLELRVLDTHMGLFDFTIRTMAGDYNNGLKYAAHIFEEPIYEGMADGTSQGYEARGKCYFATGYVPIIWLPRKPETPREYATLAHEAIHAVSHMFDWANTPFTRDTEETFGHSVAHVVNNVLEKL